jgi:hypothetical protein
MRFNANNQQTRPKEVDGLSLKDVDSFIHYMNGLLEELTSKVRALPKVDQEGNSECPFAEDLYAQKDECMEKVEQESQKLQPYLVLVEEEIARCRANLGRISSDASSLNLDEAKERYDAAKRSQESQYNNALRQRKALTDLVSRTKETLALAQSRAFPGRKPPKSSRPPAGAFGGWGGTGSRNGASKVPPGRPSLKNEIDSLISLGPLGDDNN